RITPAGSLVTVHTFDMIEGGRPDGPFLATGDGSIYGTAGLGPTGRGVVFRLTSNSLSIGSITPSSGPAGGARGAMVLGDGLAANASIHIGNHLATDVEVHDPTFACASVPALAPGTLNDVTVVNPGVPPALLSMGYLSDFTDVSRADPFHDYVETVFRAGVTAGCGGGEDCRDQAALRRQMAVLVLKAKEAPSSIPPPATGIFLDVPASDPFARWIEELYRRGVVAGCGAGPTYCPDQPVLRQQMAVFLVKTLLGSGY